MSELFKRTKEELAKNGNYTVFASVSIGLFAVYPAIFVIFADKAKIFETTLNEILFFVPMVLSPILSMLSLRQRERDARREDFLDEKESEYMEKMENEIREIVELSDKTNPKIEEKIKEFILKRSSKELFTIAENCMNKPLNEKNKFLKHFLDLIAKQKELLLIIGGLCFIILIYITK